MANPIDFYFDFSSPYGYLASTKIEEIAAKRGRSVTWRPVLLGAVFKITGGQPLPTVPLKGSYVQVRAFLDRVLNEVPVASIDQVSFHRAEPDSDRVEAQVTLTLFLLKP